MSGIVEEEIVGSQSEDSEQHDNDTNVGDVLAMFGIEDEEDEKSYNDKTPAKADAVEEKKEPRMIKVKHNKEEVEADVSDDKLPELVQRSLALDKERERKTELEKNLDRAAKLAGYKDHAEYVANFDKIEEQQKQQQQDAHNQLLTDLRQQAEEAGLDPDKLEAYLKNHPLVKEGEKALQERETDRTHREQEQQKQAYEAKWQDLYNKYPALAEDSKAWASGGEPTFFTAEMKSRIERGYDPVDAYELAHRDTLQTQTKKLTEQRVIKEQHLGLRSKVETTNDSDKEPQVPEALASAFAAFGLPVESAKKYMKKRG